MAYIVNSHRQFQPKVINYCLHLIKCRVLYTRIQEHPSIITINPLYCILIPPIASLLVTKYRRPACSKQHTALSCVRHPVNSQKQQPVVLVGELSGLWREMPGRGTDGLPWPAGDDSEWMFTRVGQLYCQTPRRRYALFTADHSRASSVPDWVDMFDLPVGSPDVVNCTGNSYNPMASRSMPTAKTFVGVRSDCSQRSQFAS